MQQPERGDAGGGRPCDPELARCQARDGLREHADQDNALLAGDGPVVAIDGHVGRIQPAHRPAACMMLTIRMLSAQGISATTFTAETYTLP